MELKPIDADIGTDDYIEDSYVDDLVGEEEETSFSEPPNVPSEEPGQTRDAAGRISEIRGDFRRDSFYSI